MADHPQVELVQRILASKPFRRSARQRELLEFLCQRAFGPDDAEIHEQEIGIRVFGRRPGYETSQDNIVRVNVSELRKKLEEYFREDGAAEPIILEIPRGNYTPVRLPRPQAEIAPPPAAAAEQEEPPPPPRSRAPLAIIALLSLACLALTAWNVLLRRELAAHSAPGVTPLWSQFFTPTRETDLIVADSCLSFYTDLVKRPIPLHDYLSRRFLTQDLATIRDAEQRRTLDLLMTRRYSSYADIEAVERITRLAALDGKPVTVQYARDYPTQRLQTSNLIIIGSKRSNPWAENFESQLNFRIEYDPDTGGNLVANLHPAPGESPVYRVISRIADIRESLAVIAYIPNTRRTAGVILLAGTGMSGTEAALEPFLSPESFARIESALPRRTSPRVPYFEALIRAQAVGGAAQSFEVLGTRIIQ
ncbi:MAG TPA: hypothetical protein VGK29_19625 [Paludibaculum sp.]